MFGILQAEDAIAPDDGKFLQDPSVGLLTKRDADRCHSNGTEVQAELLQAAQIFAEQTFVRYAAKVGSVRLPDLRCPPMLRITLEVRFGEAAPRQPTVS